MSDRCSIQRVRDIAIRTFSKYTTKFLADTGCEAQLKTLNDFGDVGGKYKKISRCNVKEILSEIPISF